MLLGFKTELKLNSQQRAILAKHAGVARHASNWGLALCPNIPLHNREDQLEKMKFPTAIDLYKLLVAMVKSENPWYYEVSKSSPQYTLKHLSDAFPAFWSKKKGFPNFRKWLHDSFTLDGSITVESRKIRVPVINWLKTYERLPQGIKPIGLVTLEDAIWGSRYRSCHPWQAIAWE